MAYLMDMIKDERGNVVACEANVRLAFQNDPALIGLYGENLLTHEIMLLKETPDLGDRAARPETILPRSNSPYDDLNVLSYLQESVSPRIKLYQVVMSIKAFAMKNRYHPIRDYLRQLKWDGVPRLSEWLHTVYGCEVNEYTVAVGRTTLIGAVRRIMSEDQNGVKFQTMIVFEGAQGLGKSTCIEKLAGAEFTRNGNLDLKSKDAKGSIRGMWIVEMDEIEQMLRQDVENVKSFLSTDVDKYRPPYGTKDLPFPRSCIFMGTTNDSNYLRDPTGDRRFYPIVCTRADFDWIVANRDQLWAEAMAAHVAGEPHHIARGSVALAMSQEVQEEKRIQDPWLEPIRAVIDRNGYNCATINSVLDIVKMDIDKITRAHRDRAASVLRALGWTSHQGQKIKGVSVTEFRYMPEFEMRPVKMPHIFYQGSVSHGV